MLSTAATARSGFGADRQGEDYGRIGRMSTPGPWRLASGVGDVGLRAKRPGRAGEPIVTRPRSVWPVCLDGRCILCRRKVAGAELRRGAAADWDRFGKRAGPIRNAEMVAAGAMLCLAFHRFLPGSKGTKDCARRALAAGIPTWLIDSDAGIPRRLRADDPRLE
jgi:hypothetical protein